MIQYTTSAKETKKLGKTLSSKLKIGDIVAFTGNLGSGKTTMIKGIVEALTGEVATSPSFVLVNEYPGKIPVFHFDLYRLKGKIELQSIGWDEYCEKGILLVEWADRVPSVLQQANIRIDISEKETVRRVEIKRSHKIQKPYYRSKCGG